MPFPYFYMPVTALLGVCYHSIHLLYIFIFIYSFYLYIFSHFILLVQPFLEKTFCYWYRNCSRNWPPFLACLPISFPGRILVLSYGKGMAGQHQRVKRRVSSFNAIYSDDGSHPPHLLHALVDWIYWLVPIFSQHVQYPLFLHDLGSLCS